MAALGAVIAAIALVAIVLFGSGGDDYKVKATFANAGQLVKGNPVQVGGVPVGSATVQKVLASAWPTSAALVSRLVARTVAASKIRVIVIAP